jgi:gluconolactonase
MHRTDGDAFVTHEAAFAAVTGANPRLIKVMDADAHEGPVYVRDEDALYFTSPGDYSVQRPHHVLAFEVRDGRHLSSQRLFAVTTPGFPDGIKVDTDGRVYVSASSGVQVFSPDGDLIGEIRVPGAVNFTFGGPDGNVLFITADTAIYAACLQAVGR